MARNFMCWKWFGIWISLDPYFIAKWQTSQWPAGYSINNSTKIAGVWGLMPPDTDKYFMKNINIVKITIGVKEILVSNSSSELGHSLFLLFFLPIFLFSILSESLQSTYISNYEIFWCISSVHDCVLKVIHNMVTALLEYFNNLAIFPQSFGDWFPNYNR